MNKIENLCQEILRENGSDVTITKVAEVLEVNRSTIVTALDILKSDGLIEFIGVIDTMIPIVSINPRLGSAQK